MGYSVHNLIPKCSEDIKQFGPALQRAAEGEVKTTAAGYNITIKYLASYDIKALVVHTKNYPGVDYPLCFHPAISRSPGAM